MPSTSSVIVTVSANLPETANVILFSNILEKNMDCIVLCMFLDFFEFGSKLQELSH